MIRIRLLIQKHDLFSYIENPEIVKVIMHSKRNLALKKDYLCDIHAYYQVEFSDIATILGACKVIINKDGLESFLSGADHAFLNGIQTQKQHAFLSKSMVNKLIEIEKRYDVNLCISKEIINILNKNNEKKS